MSERGQGWLGNEYQYGGKRYSVRELQRMAEQLDEAGVYIPRSWEDDIGWEDAIDVDPSKLISAWKRLRATSRDPSRRLVSPLKKKLAPSPRLALLTGHKKVTRAQAVSAVWRYIKRYHLQLASDGRRFKVQGALKGLFPGKKQANMFQVAKAVSRNLR